jgi:hypothetical protein
MSWIQTVSGAKFYLLEPERNEYRIEDIAYALANKPRFASHCRPIVTVAQHSILMAETCEDKATALMHDAAEAYLGDMPRPLKRLLPLFKELENKHLAQMAKVFGFTFPLPPEIKVADNRWLETERRAFLRPPLDWELDCEPYEMTKIQRGLVYCTPRVIERMFLELAGSYLKANMGEDK